MHKHITAFCLGSAALSILLTAAPVWVEAGDVTQPAAEESIRLNQLGFYPSGAKLAVVPASSATGFQVISIDGTEVHHTGILSPPQLWSYSGERVQTADFTSFDSPGEYRLSVEGVGRSYPFEIGNEVFRPVAEAALKGLYFNRSGLELTEEFAGPWAREAGHPDTEVLVHPTAASKSRPAGTVLASPGGWYNAGDYNKYMISSAFATSILLMAWEHYPDAFRDLETGIPESGDDVPDLVDEAIWNLRWMLTMQDPDDGGVYHKLSTTDFAGFLPNEFVMPVDAVAPRFLYSKSSAAALDFAATMAIAGRVLGAWPETEPLARECLSAAKAAWHWAEQHPDVMYEEPEDTITGAYSYDYEDLTDERAWAATELFLATGSADYLEGIDLAATASGVPSWDWVSPLAWLSLANNELHPPNLPEGWIERQILVVADRQLAAYSGSAYRVAMGAFKERFEFGQSEMDFSWGSNGMAVSQGLVLLAAYRLTGCKGYLDAASAEMDYLLGRNPLNVSFVTGFGDNTPQNIRHRQSVADEVEAPVPGFLVGGPHAGLQDRNYCVDLYQSELPALAWVDDPCSFATNSVSITWNAPLVYLAGAVDELVEP